MSSWRRSWVSTGMGEPCYDCYRKFAVIIAVIIGVILAVPVVLNIYSSSTGQQYEYVCLLTWNRGVVKAVILDSESERACGLNCVREDVAIFLWREETPRTVTFVNNLGNETEISLYHVVSDRIYRVYELYPGESVTVITLTDRDYFIETRGDIVLDTVYYRVCR